ncbi:hypothetical protein AB834_04010 [PVC group bacterium (ex Bugula neritina AB1)]|nr:hypothetical protein AB834_04010 [PVC group bacterium (ex Bugula neritina AB1)]
MFPILFQKGFLTIHTYGFMVALAVLLACVVSRLRAKAHGFSKTFVDDISFYALIGGLLGARLFYVCQDWSYFQKHLVEIFLIHKGGLVFYGGLIGGIISSTIVVIRKGENWIKVADFFTPVVPMGHAVGRLGCFLNGCCYGTSNAGEVFPVQLWESGFNFFLAFILFSLSFLKNISRGMLTSLYTFSYGLGRFVLEFYRGDDVLEFFFLRISQWFSLALIGCSLLGLVLSYIKRT